jgi:hypothetical protein
MFSAPVKSHHDTDAKEKAGREANEQSYCEVLALHHFPLLMRTGAAFARGKNHQSPNP